MDTKGSTKGTKGMLRQLKLERRGSFLLLTAIFAIFPDISTVMHKLLWRNSLAIVLLLFASPLLAQSDSSEPEAYEQAIELAKEKFEELPAKWEQYKLVTIENLMRSGSDREGPAIWRLTFLDRAVIGEDGDLTGKGGQLFFKVDLDSGTVKEVNSGE
jgi:hypothetical protein